MSAPYPVTFDARRPESFSRVQLALRLLLLLLGGFLGWTLGALFCVLYLGLPAFAAVWLSQDQPERYLESAGPRVARFLRWVIAIFAYFAIVLDRLPTHEPDGDLYLEVRLEGQPQIGSALLRILYGLPSVIVFAVVLFFAALAWLFAFVIVLVKRSYGGALYDFQVGVLRWMARLLAYQASLVESYPPFSLGGTTAPPPVQAPGHP